MSSLDFNKNKDFLKDSKLFMSGLCENLKALMGMDIEINNPQMGEFPIHRIVEEFFETSLVVSVTDSEGKKGLMAANKETLEAINSKGDESAVRMLFHTALLNTANSAQAIGGIVEVGDEEESKAYWSSIADINVLVVAYEVSGMSKGQIVLAFPLETVLQTESVVGPSSEAHVLESATTMEETMQQPQQAFAQPAMQQPQQATKQTMQQPQQAMPTGPQVSVAAMQLPDLDEAAHSMQAQALNYIDDIPMQITVEVGRSRMSVREILGINKGSIIPLDRMADDPVDVLVNGKLFAKGEIVVIDDFFGVRLVEVIQNSNFKLANKSQL